MSEGVIFAFATIYFWQINNHWFYFVLVGYLLAVIDVIFVFALPESPVFLLQKGLVDEAAVSLNYIAKINKR